MQHRILRLQNGQIFSVNICSSYQFLIILFPIVFIWHISSEKHHFKENHSSCRMNSSTNFLDLVFKHKGFYGIAKKIASFLSARELLSLANARLATSTNEDDMYLFDWLFRHHEVRYPNSIKKLVFHLNLQESLSFENCIIKFAINVLNQDIDYGWLQDYCASTEFVNRLDHLRVLDYFGKVIDFETVAYMNENMKVNFQITLSEANDDDPIIIAMDTQNQFQLKLHGGAKKELLRICDFSKSYCICSLTK